MSTRVGEVDTISIIVSITVYVMSIEKNKMKHILKFIMWKKRLIALVFIALGVFLGSYVYRTEMSGKNPFRLGLDLKGGSYLVYRADVSEVPEKDIQSSMASLRDVIERRVNAFGIAEPQVLTEHDSITGEERLIVELPGVTDVHKATEMIGQTPLLEFRVERTDEEKKELKGKIDEIQKVIDEKKELNDEQKKLLAKLENDPKYLLYKPTELTGKYLEKAILDFKQAGIQNGGAIQAKPIVSLRFNSEGAKLFEDITSASVGKILAIYLDGTPIEEPRVKTAITDGSAIIEGNFTVESAKQLVGRLNSGALPIPIELISTNTIGPTLGHDAVDAGVKAGWVGFLLVALILIVWYRLPGLLATIALGIYSAIMLWLFKFIPVTLTSAGIVGFIISIGIAVDANILIFERMKEELAEKKPLYDAIKIGFDRAWPSIRDANISSIISAVILFWFGTPLIKGFALTFGLGIIVSMFTAITVTRSMMLSLSNPRAESISKKVFYLFMSGFYSYPKKKAHNKK